MNLLLDTHAFLWWHSQPAQLSPVAYAACIDPNHQLWLSLASIWEIQIKVQIGKLTLQQPLRGMLTKEQTHNNLRILPVSLEHVLTLDTLPFHHKDPFDRMLIAQAKHEGWSILSKDSEFKLYPVTVLW